MDLMLILEAKAENRREAEAFKRAVLSADPQKYVPLLYPKVTRKAADPEEIEDTGPAEYEFAEQVDPREAERMLADLMKGKGSMTMDDVERYTQD